MLKLGIQIKGLLEHGFNQNHLTNILRGCGFTDIESKTFLYDEKRMEDQLIKFSFCNEGQKI